MIVNIEKMLSVLNDQIVSAVEEYGEDDDRVGALIDQLSELESQLLDMPIHSESDLVSKLRVVSSMLCSGDRSDGRDVVALGEMAQWATKRWPDLEEERRSAA